MQFVPLAEASPEDIETEYSGFLDTPVAKVNVVNVEGVNNILNDVWDTIKQVKTRRASLENEWLAIQRMTVLEHDDGQKYKGRSNAYLPVYARARKTLASAIMRGLFPSDDFMDVVDRENGETEAAKAVKTVVQYEMETSACIRKVFKPFVGQFVDFGFSVMKRFYRTNKIIKPKRSKYPKGVIPDKMGETVYDEGFTLSNRSVFNVVVYPEWAEEKRDLTLEAERMEVPVSYVNQMASSKRWLNVAEALSTGGNDNFDWCNQSSMTDVSKIAGTTQFRNKTGSVVNSVTIVEAWFKMVFPRAQYALDEDPTVEVPARAVFVNGVPVLCRRNNLYDQQSPFEYGRDNIITGNFYGNGAGRLVRFLQYLANDFANQINDVGIYGLNPVTLINTTYFSGAADNLRPGRTYRVRDVEQAMKFVSPKVEIVQYGQTMLSQIVVMTQDGSGAPPVLQGSKAANTATGSQLLSQNAQSPLQDAVEDLEAQVMVPLMQAAWALSRQFRNKPFLRKVLGEPPMDPMTQQPMMDPMTNMPMPAQMETVEILPADIEIDAQMRYLASSQANSRQMRQQGLMAFTQLMMPLLPILQQQGKTVNPEIILQKGWSDGLGNRGFDKLIIPMPMAMPPPGQAIQPQQQSIQPPPVEQGNVLPMGEAEPLPGEEFGDMRNMIDSTNGMMNGGM